MTMILLTLSPVWILMSIDVGIATIQRQCCFAKKYAFAK